MNNTRIVTENLSRTYTNGRKEIKAIYDVSIEIKLGESAAIIGPSGAGKSTLLHLLGGLDMPTMGKVLLGDVDIYKLSDSERAGLRNRRVGFVFQFYHLLPEFTALENVMMPAVMERQRAKGQGAWDRREEIAGKARDILKAVGLSARADHKPSELSGGEAQRVAIARALINEPDILLCDEPTGNLDSKTSQSIYELLTDIRSRNNMTLVIVTHDENISKLASRIIHIKDGTVTS